MSLTAQVGDLRYSMSQQNYKSHYKFKMYKWFDLKVKTYTNVFDAMSSSGVDTPEDDIRSKTFVYVLFFKSKH